ncbi:MAG: ATP-binding cassette domain-containing protein [Lachnospiraceae bacterium]|nr:ATP-binding cassette domain-containing protein [Lachnospiraceae bacterium]
MDNILTVKDVHVSFLEERRTIFDKRNRIEVLKGIDLSIGKGEIVGLVGESGCGKSTLAKVILGLIRPDSGEVIHESERPQMIFQDPYSSLNPAKTVRFILEEPLKNQTNLTAEERLIRAKERLIQAGLDEKYLNRKPSELSGGQRQRVCIAQSLMMDPKLLIADEPVSALDVTIQAQILKLLDDLQENLGLSILFISHDLRVVYQLCDRVMVLRDGVIVEEGEVDEVYRNPKHEYTKRLLQASGIE